MSFKIQTLFEQALPPITIKEDNYYIHFEHDSAEDIADILASVIQGADHLDNLQLIDVTWDEGFRDEFSPSSGHYTVPDGDFTMEDWSIDAPESITLVMPFLGSPQEDLMPKYVSPHIYVESDDGGSAVMEFNFPVASINLSSDKSLIAITLGQSESEKVIEASTPEPDGEPDDYYDDRY